MASSATVATVSTCVARAITLSAAALTSTHSATLSPPLFAMTTCSALTRGGRSRSTSPRMSITQPENSGTASSAGAAAAASAGAASMTREGGMQPEGGVMRLLRAAWRGCDATHDAPQRAWSKERVGSGALRLSIARGARSAHGVRSPQHRAEAAPAMACRLAGAACHRNRGVIRRPARSPAAARSATPLRIRSVRAADSRLSTRPSSAQKQPLAAASCLDDLPACLRAAAARSRLRLVLPRSALEEATPARTSPACVRRGARGAYARHGRAHGRQQARAG